MATVTRPAWRMATSPICHSGRLTDQMATRSCACSPSANKPLRSRFNVSVAEVADLDRWQTLAIGVTCATNDSRHANEVMSKIVDFAADHNGGGVLYQHRIEILRT